MERRWTKTDAGSPEMLAPRLQTRLRRHFLWDSLLLFVPPLAAFLYGTGLLFQWHWIGAEVLVFSAAAGFGIALALGCDRVRGIPTVPTLARLIDDKVHGRDRFLTLATLNLYSAPSSLVLRLKDEAKRLLHRVNLTKDFPYRIKRGALVSCLTSAMVVLAFRALLPAALSPWPTSTSLREIVEGGNRLWENSASALTRQVEGLMSRLRRQIPLPWQAPPAKLKQASESITPKEPQPQRPSDSQLSDRVARARGGEDPKLKDRGSRRDPRGSGGALQNSKELRGGKRETRGPPSKALSSKNSEDRKEKDLKGGEAKAGIGGGDRGMGARQRDQTHGGSSTRQRKIPKGKTPERFRRPGEDGGRGLQGARFVTVELPEDAAPVLASGPGEGGTSPSKLPVSVSNIPLPPPQQKRDHDGEIQHIPLEYRQLIR